jgi:hypothetical protein
MLATVQFKTYCFLEMVALFLFLAHSLHGCGSVPATNPDNVKLDKQKPVPALICPVERAFTWLIEYRVITIKCEIMKHSR